MEILLFLHPTREHDGRPRVNVLALLICSYCISALALYYFSLSRTRIALSERRSNSYDRKEWVYGRF